MSSLPNKSVKTNSFVLHQKQLGRKCNRRKIPCAVVTRKVKYPETIVIRCVKALDEHFKVSSRREDIS